MGNNKLFSITINQIPLNGQSVVLSLSLCVVMMNGLRLGRTSLFIISPIEGVNTLSCCTRGTAKRNNTWEFWLTLYVGERWGVEMLGNYQIFMGIYFKKQHRFRGAGIALADNNSNSQGDRAWKVTCGLFSCLSACCWCHKQHGLQSKERLRGRLFE